VGALFDLGGAPMATRMVGGFILVAFLLCILLAWPGRRRWPLWLITSLCASLCAALTLSLTDAPGWVVPTLRLTALALAASFLTAAGVGLYATENTGTHDVTLWQWHWSAVPDWVPVVTTAAVIGVLFLLYMAYSGLVHGVRVGSMRKRVTTRESTIGDLRRDNQRLREENTRVRSELRGMDRGVAATSDRAAMATDRGMVETPVRNAAPAYQDTSREPVAAGTSVDRSHTAPYRPRATFSERVRAFFSGREPAGY
jgi:hypothetical protein